MLDVFPTFAEAKNPHRDSSTIRELLTDTSLVSVVHALCGENLSIWRTAFFAKSTGSGEIGWHHDKHFQSADQAEISLEEIDLHFSVFIGLTNVNASTGQIEMIPGSHLEDLRYRRDRRPFHLRPLEDHFLGNLPPEVIEARRGIDIDRGCFFVFHSALLHRSLPHAGGPPRVGLAVRLARRGIVPPPALAEPGDIAPFGAPVAPAP